MVNSVEKMTNDIIYLIIGLIILASVFGAIAGTFYTSWTGVNMTALGGDDTTQTTWDLVPTLFFILVPLAVLMIVVYVLIGKVKKTR